jgi:hypothetical protein
MRITIPWSFWLAVAINLPYVDAFTPPNLYTRLVGGGGGGRVTNTPTSVSHPLHDNTNNGRRRLQLIGGVCGGVASHLERVSPFYFANLSTVAADDAGDNDNANQNIKKYGQSEIARARTSYLDWCSEYRKTPDEKRFQQFVDNFLIMEKMARKQGTQVRLNEFADFSAAEYQQMMKKGVGAGGGPGQSQLNKNLRFVDTTSKKPTSTVPSATTATNATANKSDVNVDTTANTTNSTQAATQRAQDAAQKAGRAVSAAQQKIGDASAAASQTPPAKTANSSTTITPDDMGDNDAKTRQKEMAKEAERKRLALIAQAEAAQRAEAERARLRAAEEKAKRDAELAAQKAAAEKERAEKERAKQEAIAEQRRKVEEAERKRRELVARAEAAQRAEAAAAKAKAEAEEKKRKERKAAEAAVAKAKAEEEERQQQLQLRKQLEEEERQRKLKEEEERLQREREEVAAKAEAARLRAEEEARLKKEEEERAAAALEAKRKAEELAKKQAEEARLKKEQEERAAAQAALEAKRKAEEEAKKRAEEKALLKKEKEERAAAEAKRKAEELERLAKERQMLLAKKREQEEEAKRKKEEVALLKRKQEAEAHRQKLIEEEQKKQDVEAAAAKLKAEEEQKKKDAELRAIQKAADQSTLASASKTTGSTKQDPEKKRTGSSSLESWWNSFRYGESISAGSRKRQRPSMSKEGDKKYDAKDPAVQARVKSVYLEWCKTYNKTPSDSRFPQFMERYLLTEEFSIEGDVEITLNEYADCTEEEYREQTSKASSESGPSIVSDRELTETTDRLLSVLSNEQKKLSQLEEKLGHERDKAISEHQLKLQQVLEARAVDLKQSKIQVSNDTINLLSKLADAKSKLQEMERDLAAERKSDIVEYQKRKMDVSPAESKRLAEEEVQRQREQRELAAQQKMEEDKRRQEELEAKQKAEAEEKKKAEDKKRLIEAIAREKRKAEEELAAKKLAAQSEAKAAEKRSREEKRQKEITAKAKAAAIAAKRVAKEKKSEKEKSEKASEKPVDPKPLEKVDSPIAEKPDDSLVPINSAKSPTNDEKSLDEQLAELTSRIDELQRDSAVDSDETSTDPALEDDSVDLDIDHVLEKESIDAKDDSVDSSDDSDDDSDKMTAVSDKKEDLELNEEAKKKASEGEDLRVRSAYLDWCITYSKKPDMARIQQFKKNYLLIEEFAKENGKEIKLNEYADCTAAEYDRAMKEKEEAKKKEEEEQKKREEEAAAAYKAAVDEASQLFGIEGNKTAVSRDSEDDDPRSPDGTFAAGDPDDVWKTGEPTMSMWEPEDEGSTWASEGGASLWESSEWGEIDESYAAYGSVDPDDPEVRKRVRAAYSNWCKEYNKDADEGRFPRFKSNYLKMEQIAWEQGREVTLNEFADCSPEEYRNAMEGGPLEEEERLERLRIEQEEQAEQAVARKRENRIERLRREQEEEAARLSAKRTVEPVWKVAEPQKRVRDIRVDWDEDETAAMEEVERMAMAKAEAAARRVEEARKKKNAETRTSSFPETIRSSKNDVDRQLKQKAMNERSRREQKDEFVRRDAEPLAFDDEQAKLESEWAAKAEAKQVENDRLRRQWEDRNRSETEGNDFENSGMSSKGSSRKSDPSPAFNLGSIFGMGNNNGMSGFPPPYPPPYPPPPMKDPVSDPSQPIVKPPGSFEPRVKAPAYDNRAWQDQYIKNYNPTVGSRVQNGASGASDSVSTSSPSSSGGSYYMDSSDAPGSQGRPSDAVPPGNREWYEDSLSQSRDARPASGPLSGMGQTSTTTASSGVAPDEAELDATPSRFAQGAGSYLENLSPPSSNVDSQPADDNNQQSFASSAPSSPPQQSTTPAVSPPRRSNGGSYLDELQSQYPERIESAYRDWCQYYGKTASEDRLRIFASNFLAVEKYHRETGVSLILNELADMTSDEFQSKNGKSGP